jgi:hypothetical protein
MRLYDILRWAGFLYEFVQRRKIKRKEEEIKYTKISLNILN